jgi:subtilisin family serine protease
MLACSALADEADAVRQQVLVLLQMPAPHFRADTQYSGGYSTNSGHGHRLSIASQLAERHGLSLVTDWAMPALGVDCYVMALPPSRNPAEVVQELSRDSRVAWVQPMNLFRAQAQTPAPSPTQTEPLYRMQPAAELWHLSTLHGLAQGRGVKVAVVDSAVEVNHPDLAGQVVGSENLVDRPPSAGERHGTAVAGIVAARADNHKGIAGVAPQARVLALRGCWQAADGSTLCSSLGLAKALQAAIMARADIVNLSLSGPSDRLLGLLIDAARQRGASVVVAHDRALPGGGFPASHPGVVAVSDTAGPGVLSAPGQDIPAPAPGARWEVVSGSSYAAAHVSGLLALMRELGGPKATLVHLEGGEIDACGSLKRASGGRGAPCDAPMAAIH